MEINNIIFIFLNLKNNKFKWGLGIGDWGLGIGDWAQSPIPIPNPQNLFLLILNKENN